MRGSSTGSGATGSGAGSSSAVEMLGGSGAISSSGKSTVVKKYFVTDQANLESAPAVPGLVPTNITHTKIGVGWEQTVTYEARTGGVVLGSSGFEKSAERGSFEIFSSYELRPIGRHPRIGQLKEKYNGRDEFGEIVFDEFLSSGSGVGGKRQRNPMYMVKNYREYTYTVRYTYYVDKVNVAIFNLAGTTTTKLPGDIPVPKGARDSDGKEIKRSFQIQMPSIRREGGAWRVEQDYVLVDSAGFAEDIFEK